MLQWPKVHTVLAMGLWSVLCFFTCCLVAFTYFENLLKTRRFFFLYNYEPRCKTLKVKEAVLSFSNGEVCLKQRSWGVMESNLGECVSWAFKLAWV